MTTGENTLKHVLGNKVSRSQWKPLRDVIGGVERTPSGNIVLRAGAEMMIDGPWQQHVHVVLEPDEARELLRAITAALESDEEAR